ncbi:MAG TPA: VOC family protein [Thermomicrobiales bacterium]|nr:VOC family protein [Thermomicrobiales bacterium]
MEPNFTILYVGDMPKSAAFYDALIQREPVEASANFRVYVLSTGARVALWQRDDVQPAATAPGGVEFCLAVTSPADVDAVAATWRERGIPIAQDPVLLEFGYSFVGLDPDGHRLRVHALSSDPAGTAEA